MERVPAVGQQLVEAALWPALGQRAEHVGEIRQGRHPVLGRRTQQAIEHRGAVRSLVRAGEEKVFATERDVAELLLADGMPRARLCRVRP